MPDSVGRDKRGRRRELHSTLSSPVRGGDMISGATIIGAENAEPFSRL